MRTVDSPTLTYLAIVSTEVDPWLPTGKFAGIHVGRLIVRASGVFELISAKGKVSPVRHKYCKTIHRKDGYMYALSTFVQ